MGHWNLNARKAGGSPGPMLAGVIAMTFEWPGNSPRVLSGIGTEDGIFECGKQ